MTEVDRYRIVEAITVIEEALVDTQFTNEELCAAFVCLAESFQEKFGKAVKVETPVEKIKDSESDHIEQVGKNVVLN